MRNILTIVSLVLIAYILVLTVVEMPPFGAADNPTNNIVSERYINEATTDTGTLNSVSSVIMDYRAFDTLGELTVLFVAVAATLSCLKAHAQ